jgi:2-polyprenyl-3-methyl-5-hydroxy-6-metoxy-1,4-benzoquinol methylase
MELFIEFPKYPKTISNLFNDPQSAKKSFISISFLKCCFCNHVQIAEDMPQEFYEDYVMTVSHSKKMNDFQYEQAKYFIEKYNLRDKKVLEVGCGDGNFLNILRASGVKAYGNEPSTPFRELALKKGLNVDDKFVNENYKHADIPFDAVISREVMEHVPAPVEFLRNIRKLLKPEGHILIEVPNFEKAIRELRYYDMFPDHLSYFTKESLTAAMLLSGYSNVEIFYGMEDEFIYAIAKNRSLSSSMLIKAKNSIQSEFEKLFNEYNYIVVWGAGGKGISALGSLNDSSKIKYIVDSDPYKQGRYIPSAGILVKSPEDLFDDNEVELIVLTNLAYTDEILNILKQNNFKARIKVLSPNGLSDINY